MKNVRKMVLASLFASLCAVCSWISIPIPPVYITLQTLALLLTLGTLGGKWGSVSVSLYLLLGLVGLPVFAGFRGGAGALLDATGGFLWGFLVASLVYWLLERLGRLPAMVGAMAVCYLCGCLWFQIYAGDIGLGKAFLLCVAPYLLPDGIKLWMALSISARLAKQLPK
jgi:biotin transport system substrate-specific component